MTMIVKLREERFTIVQSQRAIADAADALKRELNGEELAELGKLEVRYDELDSQIKLREKIEGRKATDGLVIDANRDGKPLTETELENRKRPTETTEYRNAYTKYLINAEMTSDERRALSVGTNSAGGFTVPLAFSDKIIKALRQFGEVRSLATTIATAEGNALDIPASNGFGASAWGTEAILIGGTDAVFAKVTYNAYKANHLTLVSEELLQDTGFDLEGYLATVIGENLAILQNTGFVVGTGTGQPTGLATAATTNGVTAANATSQVTAIISDTLYDVLHSVGPQYRKAAECTWLMHDSSVKIVRKLKDTTGEYLWQPNLTVGAPDTLLGFKVSIDPDMPVMAANARSIVFGDFSRYYVRTAGGISVQRLNERYAEVGQVGFRAFERVDGKIADAAGIRTFINAAS